MAKRSAMDVPPAVSSSEEEEEDVEEEEEEETSHGTNGRKQPKADESEEDEDEDDDVDEDEDEDEEEEPAVKNNKNHSQKDSKPASKNPKPNPQEDSDSDSDGSETESDSPSPSPSDFTIKPHATTSPAMKPKKLAMPAEKPNLKRPAENSNHTDDKDSKSKAKKVKTSSHINENGGGAEGGAATEKKGMITRVWSDENEIAVLKGLIDFQTEKGTDPTADYTAFHEFMKQFLSVDMTRSQLMDKVRRMKKKYQNLVGKADNGEDPVLSKPHEYRLFQMSKKVWGGADAASDSKTKRKAKLPETPIKANTRNTRKKAKSNTEQAEPIAKPEEASAAVVTNHEEPSTRKQTTTIATPKGEEGEFSELYPYLSAVLKLSTESTSSQIVNGRIKSFEQRATLVGESKLKELEEKCKKQSDAEMEVLMERSGLIRELLGEVLKST